MRSCDSDSENSGVATFFNAGYPHLGGKLKRQMPGNGLKSTFPGICYVLEKTK